MHSDARVLLLRILTMVAIGIALQQGLIFRRHYGVCGKLLREAERTVDQKDCKNPLTRIDSEFIKCGSADDLIADGQFLCAVNKWADGWQPSAFVAKIMDVSMPMLIAGLVMLGVAAHVLVNAWVADRHNQRQIQLMRDSVPALMQQHHYARNYVHPPHQYIGRDYVDAIEHHQMRPIITYETD